MDLFGRPGRRLGAPAHFDRGTASPPVRPAAHRIARRSADAGTGHASVLPAGARPDQAAARDRQRRARLHQGRSDAPRRAALRRRAGGAGQLHQPHGERAFAAGGLAAQLRRRRLARAALAADEHARLRRGHARRHHLAGGHGPLSPRRARRNQPADRSGARPAGHVAV